MFPKATLTFLAVGVFSVSALIVPVARSPAPEPESQGLEARILPGLAAYDLFSRELEDWAGFARGHYTAKREPSPGDTLSRPGTSLWEKTVPTVPPPAPAHSGKGFVPTLQPIPEHHIPKPPK